MKFEAFGILSIRYSDLLDEKRYFQRTFRVNVMLELIIYATFSRFGLHSRPILLFLVAPPLLALPSLILLLTMTRR